MPQFSFVVGVDFSCFVGDLAPDVTDYVLQEHFRAQYPSVRSAKVSLEYLLLTDCILLLALLRFSKSVYSCLLE